MHSEGKPMDRQALYLLGFSTATECKANQTHNLATKLATQRIRWADQILMRQYGIEYLESGPIRAWYKKIERDQFEGAIGEKNLADIQWLTPRVLAHETVVSTLSKQLPFYPARFGTLFSSEQALSQFALSVAKQLMQFFDTVAGKHEWGVKLFADTTLGAKILAEKTGILENGKPTGGANYLKLRRMQRDREQATQEMFHIYCIKASQSLANCFSHVVTRPIHSIRTDGVQEELMGNHAVLTNAAEASQLDAWITNWNENETPHCALRIQLTGPWPTYSFCPSLVPSDDQVRAA